MAYLDEPIYTNDKKKKAFFRMNDDLNSRIENFMKTNNVGAWDKSKAIRALIEMGLLIWVFSLALLFGSKVRTWINGR